MHGIIEFEVGGKKRGLKFGQYGLLIASRKDECSLSEFFTRVLVDKETLSFINLLYGCAVSYAESKGKKVDFTPEDMNAWINELGVERMTEYIQEGLKAPEVKN